MRNFRQLRKMPKLMAITLVFTSFCLSTNIGYPGVKLGAVSETLTLDNIPRNIIILARDVGESMGYYVDDIRQYPQGIELIKNNDHITVSATPQALLIEVMTRDGHEKAREILQLFKSNLLGKISK